MNFKTKKIRNKPLKKKIEKPKRDYNFKINLSQKDKFWLKLILLLIICVPLLGYAANTVLSNSGNITSTILKTVGSDLETDENGYTNILALGVGGMGHDGEELTDTILVASINKKTDQVVMMSMPRDLFVQHDNIISQRINSVFENVKYKQGEEIAFQTMKDIATEITGLDIHYYAKIDFQGLVDVVNELGGIEIYNETTIYDPYYPAPNYQFQTFSLGKGLQQLDGQTALKFVRSRKTTSDFDRANRQQQVIFAIKEKALQANILTSPSKISGLLTSIKNNFETDLTIGDITTLAGISTDIEESDLNKLVIHNDPVFEGGFLYTPPRSLYGDAFVLLPAGNNYEQIQNYIKIHSIYAEQMKHNVGVEVLNGTKQSGFARNTALILERYGFNVDRIANADSKDITETRIYITPEVDKKLIEALELVVPAVEVIKKGNEPHPLDDPNKVVYPITIEIGSDYIDNYNNLEVFNALIPIIEQAEKERLEAIQGASEESQESESEEEISEEQEI
jgi:LCP family protein required for cell wall assembly